MAEIRFAGYGGQGIIRSGIIAGKAASIHDNKHATMSQSFGPEARGGACSSQLVISDSKVLYPYITNSDVLVAMSQAGYDKFEPEISKEGMLLYDEDLVKPKPSRGKIQAHAIPATRFAEELGYKIVANVVMLGFFTAITNLVTYDSMKKALPGLVPEKALQLNLKAFDRGYTYGKELLDKKQSTKGSE
ncbi:MAG: 2-oxoacid:acceptor oxidoreductase family protein [candidate division WOR-3 bacterium]|nr:MAG: 2-oxoacid:acceptor oxidoreductase family protein [candidate division WOR-3 bacterium]